MWPERPFSLIAPAADRGNSNELRFSDPPDAPLPLATPLGLFPPIVAYAYVLHVKSIRQGYHSFLWALGYAR